jgi:hypothetical protein
VLENQRPRCVAFYLRVSTDGETVENQRRELEAVAERHAWQIVQIFAEEASAARRAEKSGQHSMPCSRASRVGSSTLPPRGQSTVSAARCAT